MSSRLGTLRIPFCFFRESYDIQLFLLNNIYTNQRKPISSSFAIIRNNMLKRKFKNKYTNYRDISFFLKFYILWPNTSSNVRMYYTCKIHRVEPILRARNTKTSVFQAPRTTRNFYTVFESQCRFTNAYDIKMRRTISILRRVHEP